MIRHWTLERQDGWRSVDGGLALLAIERVGCVGFADSLLAELARAGEFEHCTVYRFARDGAQVTCDVVDSASRHRVPTAQRTSALFAQRFAHLDLNGRFLGAAPAAGQMLASYLASHDIPYADYRDACYLRNRLVDRLSLLTVDKDASSAVALNLYRSERNGPLSAGEHEHLLRCGPVLAAAAARHVALLRPAATSGADLLARIPAAGALSARERQVCCLLLDGLTVQAAAASMGIRGTTAITLKKRAYARLGVRTRDDLLRLAAVHRPGAVLRGEDRPGTRLH